MTPARCARGTLWHVLSSCGSSLQMYTWRHNRVLAILAEITETQCRVANEQPTQDPKPCISFLQEGEAPPRQVSKPQSSWIWSKVRKSTTVWQNRPPSSLLPYPHPTPPQPHPSPTLSLPPPPPPSLSPRVHTEHPVALAPPSDITGWLKLLAALECGVPPVAAETT